MNRRLCLTVCALGSFALLVLSGCHQVPVTGRSAMVLTDDKEVARLSLLEFDKMKSRYRVTRNRADTERVQRIGDRLARVVFWDMPSADWEFTVFDAPNQINAFALPGGKVGVFSGLFKIAQTDDQLAAVIAHEIAHVTAKHTHQRLSDAMLVQAAGATAGVATVATTGSIGLGASAMQGTQMLGSLTFMLPFDRAKEKEADHIGLIYMARAGYNPEEAIVVFERLEQETGGQGAPVAWMSTHPSHGSRIIQLLDLMPKALETYKQARAQAPVLVK